MFFPRLPPWIALTVILGFAALLRISIAAIPLERDEGEYAYIGERWLEHGEVPYRDSFDQKPPAVFLIYGLIIKTLGRSPAAIHWGAQLFSFATLAALYFLARRLFTSQIALMAGLLCAVMVTDRTVLGNAANTEVFMLLPLVLALWAALRARDRDSILWSMVAGAMSAVAICFKQVALPNLLLCALVVGVAPIRRWLKLGAILFGATALLLPLGLYFWGAGAWREFYDCVVGHNLTYASQVPLRIYPILFWMNFNKILASCWPIYLFAMFGLISALPSFRQLRTQPTRHQPVFWIALWLAFSMAGVAVGGIFREHYFIQILPCIALLAAIGVQWLADHFQIPRLAWIATLVLLYYPIGLSLGYYLPGSPLDKSRRIYDPNPFAESPEAARFIASNSTPEDTIFILGSEPQILFYAQRRSATHYIFSYPLTMPFHDARQRQDAAIEEVRRAHPRFIVTVFVRTSLLASRSTPREIFRFTRSLLKESYELAAATPVTPSGAARLITGTEVRELWRRSPVWYDTKSWCSLAIWQRTDKTACRIPASANH